MKRLTLLDVVKSTVVPAGKSKLMLSPFTVMLSQPWALIAKAIGQLSFLSGMPFLMHFSVMSALNTSFCFFMVFDLIWLVDER